MRNLNYEFDIYVFLGNEDLYIRERYPVRCILPINTAFSRFMLSPEKKLRSGSTRNEAVL